MAFEVDSMTGKDEVTTYEALMGSQGIDGISNETALERIGRLIDYSGDLTRDEGIERALEWCRKLEERGLSNVDGALLAYSARMPGASNRTKDTLTSRSHGRGNSQNFRNKFCTSDVLVTMPDLQNFTHCAAVKFLQIWRARLIRPAALLKL
jgi:hypothetical protein